ncbi:MAG TPA: helix-turn-helix domain-containing protein [Burkholderiales bacterium]|nr:helix-turn-helix domain-containing protein [Burkholderiales bacterium]
MSSKTTTSAHKLAQLHADRTQRLILEAAVSMLEEAPTAPLTMREVARRAQISERTIFRYFATREALLDAVAVEVVRGMAQPPHPRSLEELLAAPRALYSALDANPTLVKVALDSEVYDRIRTSQANQRWIAIRKVIDHAAPRVSERRRRFAAANIRLFLSATGWRYYRFYFQFSLEDTIECAEMAIRQSLKAIGK